MFEFVAAINYNFNLIMSCCSGVPKSELEHLERLERLEHPQILKLADKS